MAWLFGLWAWRQILLESLLSSEIDDDGFQPAKKAMWEEHGCAPWTLEADGLFAVWGGSPLGQGEADFRPVLGRCAWGTGAAIQESIVRRAFTGQTLATGTVLLLPSRARIRSMLRLGLAPEGEVEIPGEMLVLHRVNARTRTGAFPSQSMSRILGDGHGL